jgi:hypothetical protein
MTQRCFAVFDRDGTLIVERNYLSEATRILDRLLPPSGEKAETP